MNTEEGTGGLCLPEASLEERDGRTILIVDGVETDVTQALTDQGEYLYECGEGEEQAQVRVYLDEQGAPRLMTSFFTAGEDGGGCGCPGGRGGVRKRPHRAGLAPWCSPDC